jgi:hypothetical protein
MQIPFVWQRQTESDDRVAWLLVAPDGQVYPATLVTDHFGYFTVGLDWPSGEYRLRLEQWRDDAVVASQESESIATVFNEKPRLAEVPPMTYSLDINFGNRIKLLGYDLPVRSLAPGQSVPVTFYWQGLRTMEQSYTVFTKLLNDQQQLGGDVERLPADGYNTIYWLENEVVIDGFELPVKPNISPGVYWLNLGLYKEVNGAAISLPIMVGKQPTEQTSVTIGPIKVGNPALDVLLPESFEPEIPLSIELGEIPTINLRGYNLAQTDSELQLDLYWEGLTQMPIDWSVFVHVRNQAGETVAQMDGLAGGERYPTSVWDQGEIVTNELRISVEHLPEADYDLVVGLYDLTTGVRLYVPNSANDEILLEEDIIINHE